MINMQRLRAPRTVSPNCRYNASTGRTNLKTIEQRSLVCSSTQTVAFYRILYDAHKNHITAQETTSEVNSKREYHSQTRWASLFRSPAYLLLHYIHLYIYTYTDPAVRGWRGTSLASFPQRTSSSTTSCGRSNFSSSVYPTQCPASRRHEEQKLPKLRR